LNIKSTPKKALPQETSSSQQRKNFIAVNEGFDCGFCKKKVTPAKGGYRNHCHFCLYSLHVDENIPGDRLSRCHGLMRPVRLEAGSRKGYLGYDILHECQRCGKHIKNLLSEEDAWEAINFDRPSRKKKKIVSTQHEIAQQ